MDFRKLFFAHLFGAVLTVVLGTGAFCTYQWYKGSRLVNDFQVPVERIAKDLEGRQVSVSHGQVWPFDKGQALSVSVVSKKQVDHFVVVVADVRATAGVDQPKETKESPKEQPKDKPATPAPPAPPKVPTKVNLSGHLRLTYERFGGDWFLVGVDGLTAKAAAQFD